MKRLAAIVLAVTTPLAFAQHEPGAHAHHSEHSHHEAHSHHSAHEVAEPTHAPGSGSESERRHTPPEPPELVLPEMSSERMIELMGMDDTAPRSMLRFDELGWSEIEGENALEFEAQAWFGGDYNKLWLKSEGAYVRGHDRMRNELVWDRVVSRWWSAQLGIRRDFGEGSPRTWAAVGVQGLAPYWWEVEATAYIGAGGRTALRVAAEQDLLITQKLILQPELEAQAFGEDDPGNLAGAGLSEASIGLRLRYEIRRELAPYVGIVWSKAFGATADLVRDAGGETDETRFVAGLRFWF